MSKLPGGKPIELFCYLLLRRERPHSREVLASLLWGDCTTSLSKKYLRQALWQLHEMVTGESRLPSALLVDRDSVRFNPQGDIWLDVAAFENACQQLQDVPRHEVTNLKAEVLKAAVDLYRGDLLDGWYQDWCLFERERLQNLYLLILDKLMVYSEDNHQYEGGLEFGERILRVERAHERTYQTMMRLHHLAGDRVGAVRVYQRCAAALQEELGVNPDRHTMQILDQIRGDHLQACPAPEPTEVQPDTVEHPSLPKILARMRQVLSVLNAARSDIEKEIQAVDRIMPQQFPVLRKRRVNE